MLFSQYHLYCLGHRLGQFQSIQNPLKAILLIKAVFVIMIRVDRKIPKSLTEGVYARLNLSLNDGKIMLEKWLMREMVNALVKRSHPTMDQLGRVERKR